MDEMGGGGGVTSVTICDKKKIKIWSHAKVLQALRYRLFVTTVTRFFI